MRLSPELLGGHVFSACLTVVCFCSVGAMGMEISIRELRGPDLANGFLDTLSDLSEVNLDVQEAGEILRARLKAGTQTFVAIHENKVVGTVSLLVELKFLHRGGKVGHIEDMAVHRDFRHRRIGSTLMEHATKMAWKLGCYKVILNCFEHISPFYIQLGYAIKDVGMRANRPPQEVLVAMEIGS